MVPEASPLSVKSPKVITLPKEVATAYPPPSLLIAMPTPSHLVSGELQGGGGGVGNAGVQHATFCSAVPSSSAFVVVQVGSISQGGTHATTRQTMRPMQSMSWLHWP